MGDFHVKPINSAKERTTFYKAMLRDLEAFDYMLKNGLVEQRSDMIGAEQEICITNRSGEPQPKALEILSAVTDERYTNELALYNLEVNLSPQKLTGDCFTKVENELAEMYLLGQKAAAKYDCRLHLTGTLPTLNFRHLMFDYMTPEERYKILSQELLKVRGSNFEIYLQGVDDFQTSLDSVLFEACNTSFQLHLQIAPREFAMMHNWSQMIAGPVLAACTNSPLLFGKELWSENRIALFKQSLDTRGKRNHSRVRMPRVYFGSNWLNGSAIDLWKKDVVRFPVLLRGYGEDDPMELLKTGKIPKLKSIRLHNGTTYTWNRLCYGVADNSPHIRIECRYLPAGPTRIDEIANFAFWIGLMKGMPEDKKDFWKTTDFRTAKSNFIKAARSGLQTTLNWFGKNYRAKDLIINELLPMAENGLNKMNISKTDIDRFLEIIRARVQSERTGSSWLKQNHRHLLKKYKPSLTQRILVQHSTNLQDENRPVHEWKNICSGTSYCFPENVLVEHKLVEDVMNKGVFSVNENISVGVIRKIFDWKNFKKHLPVEDLSGNLVGMVSKNLLDSGKYPEDALARDIMIKKVVTIVPNESVKQAKSIMLEKEIGCLPVLENNKLVGILTRSDLNELELINRSASAENHQS